MNAIKLSSSIYFLSKLFFYVCLAFVVFLILFSALSFAESIWKIDIPLVEVTTTSIETRTKIQIPFMDMHIGFPNSVLVFFMWVFFGFYALYFYSLSQFFKVFTQTQVFTERSIKSLKIFGWLNLVPITFGILASLVDIFRGKGFKMDSEYLLVFIHLFVALLVYFYVDLVKKGKRVQDENDLTI